MEILGTKKKDARLTMMYKITNEKVAIPKGERLRDRPFNLKGGLWFFVSFKKTFSDNTRVIIFIFLSSKARNFFPEFNIRLYDKNSESDYFFSLHQNQNIFFSNIGNQNIFLEKNHNPLPPPFKLNGRSLTVGTIPKSYIKIVERCKIDTHVAHKYMIAHFLGLVQALQCIF
jgi:hypothetical protein